MNKITLSFWNALVASITFIIYFDVPLILNGPYTLASVNTVELVLGGLFVISLILRYQLTK